MSDFRDDGAAALEWAASYLERVRELPVLSRVEPGAIRAALPERAPETPEPFAAVLRDLDEVLMPGLTHWQSPRYFAYFATTGSEPGILAELLVAALNQIGILWRASPALQELEEVTLAWLADLLGLPDGPPRAHRGHGVDGPRHRARGCPCGGPGQARRRLLRAHALLDREGCTPARARAPARAGRRALRDAPRRPRPDGRLRGRRDDRDDVVGVDRPRPGARRPLRGRGHLAARRRRVRGQRRRVPGAAAALRRLGARRLGRRQPAQVALHADGLLGVLQPPPRRPAQRVQPRPRVPARQRGRRQPERVQPAARPTLPGAQALGRAPLLRARGPAGRDPGAPAPRRALRGVGAGRAGLGGLRPAPLLARLLPARRAPTRRTRPCSSASTRPARCSSRTRASTAGSCSASRSGTHGRPRRTSASPGTCSAARRGRRSGEPPWPARRAQRARRSSSTPSGPSTTRSAASRSSAGASRESTATRTPSSSPSSPAKASRSVRSSPA